MQNITSRWTDEAGMLGQEEEETGDHMTRLMVNILLPVEEHVTENLISGS